MLIMGRLRELRLLSNECKTELTGFGREYTYLLKQGYSFDNITKTVFK